MFNSVNKGNFHQQSSKEEEREGKSRIGEKRAALLRELSTQEKNKEAKSKSFHCLGTAEKSALCGDFRHALYM